MTAVETPAGPARARASKPLKGAAVAPGDKSISHRALIFGAMASGATSVRGLLEGEDVLRTAAAKRTLGAKVERDSAADGVLWRVEGGDWRSPERPLYFGNSGTGCRLVMGAVAGRRLEARFEGDASLRSRPMARVLEPLTRMGASATSNGGKLPVAIAAAEELRAIDYTLPTPSAQVKSAILLAGLSAVGETIIREPVPCRDHTERMLAAFGGKISVEPDGAGGRVIRVKGGQRLKPATISVPGDPSSAAFLAAAAAIVPGSDILIGNVLVNPLRAGFYETLREMGGDIAFENARVSSGEPVADIRVHHAPLRGVEVPAARAPSMIDEYPILSVVAAFAAGETMMAGLEELRVKESDRIAAVEGGLKAGGVRTASGKDHLRVFGGAPVKGGARVATHADHRIAMSFLVMGLAAREPVEIDDASMIATSFPDFFAQMRALGANLEARP